METVEEEMVVVAGLQVVLGEVAAMLVAVALVAVDVAATMAALADILACRVV